MWHGAVEPLKAEDVSASRNLEEVSYLEETMKEFRILALATILAFAFTLSAQAQMGTETDSTESTMDQQTPAAAPDTSMSNQTTSSTETLPDITVNPDPDNKFSDTEGQSNQPIDYSKNPYWPPQDWGYINSNSSPGGGN
jgi:hypothetical protein